MASLEKTISALNSLFALFNDHWFGGTLTSPVIVVQSHGKMKNTLGWCTTKKIWRDVNTNDEFYEITVCPEFFDRTIHEICGTLQHEMVHLYHLQNGIQDCSRGNTYHNRRFKEKAEACGLVVEHYVQYGWAITKPSLETIDYIDSLGLNKADFSLERQRTLTLPGGGGKTRGKWHKLVCPSCGCFVRSTKEVHIACLDCKQQMIET